MLVEYAIHVIPQTKLLINVNVLKTTKIVLFTKSSPISPNLLKSYSSHNTSYNIYELLPIKCSFLNHVRYNYFVNYNICINKYTYTVTYFSNFNICTKNQFLVKASQHKKRILLNICTNIEICARAHCTSGKMCEQTIFCNGKY